MLMTLDVKVLFVQGANPRETAAHILERIVERMRAPGEMPLTSEIRSKENNTLLGTYRVEFIS